MSSGTDMGGFSSRGVPAIIDSRTGFPYAPGLPGTAAVVDPSAHGGAAYVPSMTDGRYGTFDADDFIQGSVTANLSTGAKTFTGVASGAGTTVSQVGDGTRAHPGQIALYTGTTGVATVLVAGAAASGGLGNLQVGNGWTEQVWWFLTDVLGNVTDDYALLIGLADVFTTSAFNNAIYTHYRYNSNSGQFSLRTVVGGATTVWPGTIPIAASTWYRARLLINPDLSQIYQFIKTGTGPEVLNAIALNAVGGTFSSARLGMMGGILKLAGTAGRTLTLDRWQYFQSFTDQR